MTDKKETCRFYHRMCVSGCDKVACRAFFPEKQPLIMEGMKATCQQKFHKDCDRYKEGLVYHQARKDAHKGCPFLADKVCIRPNTFWCHGAIPPFEVKKDNFLDSCQDNDWRNCPHYSTGMAFAEEARKKALKAEEKHNT